MKKKPKIREFQNTQQFQLIQSHTHGIHTICQQKCMEIRECFFLFINLLVLCVSIAHSDHCWDWKAPRWMKREKINWNLCDVIFLIVIYIFVLVGDVFPLFLSSSVFYQSVYRFNSVVQAKMYFYFRSLSFCFRFCCWFLLMFFVVAAAAVSSCFTASMFSLLLLSMISFFDFSARLFLNQCV